MSKLELLVDSLNNDLSDFKSQRLGAGCALFFGYLIHFIVSFLINKKSEQG